MIASTRPIAISHQDGNAVHGVGAVTLRVPVPGNMRLHDTGRIRRPGPNFVVAVRRQFDRRGPALPIVLVLWLGDAGATPAIVVHSENNDNLSVSSPAEPTSFLQETTIA